MTPLHLARQLTKIENGDEDSIRAVFTAPLQQRPAQLIGITGPPGVGKSTIVAALIDELRGRGRSVAVLAVDPSSPFSGGALLGDRVRMLHSHDDSRVFVRSMASRGHLGGLAPSAPLAVMLLARAGFDCVVIETVGVGQSEIEITTLAESTIVVMAPGMGDQVQALKAGLMEIGDILLVNKADRGGAGKTAAELSKMLAGGRTDDCWNPPVLKTCALRHDGITEVVDALDEHLVHLTDSGGREQKRVKRMEVILAGLAVDQLRRAMSPERIMGEASNRLAKAVLRGELDVLEAGGRLLNNCVNTLPRQPSSRRV